MSGLLETEVRDGFVQTGTRKMLCCKHGGSRVKLSLWPFLICTISRTYRYNLGHVLKAKNFNRCCTLLVGLGGPTLVKKSMK